MDPALKPEKLGLFSSAAGPLLSTLLRHALFCFFYQDEGSIQDPLHTGPLKKRKLNPGSDFSFKRTAPKIRFEGLEVTLF